MHKYFGTNCLESSTILSAIKGMTIKIYSHKNSMCNICCISLSGCQRSYVLKEEIRGPCSFLPTLPML